MRIVYLVTGEKGQQCGVVDYTRQLARAMREAGAQTTIEELSSWSLNALIKLKEKYKGDTDIVFHLQYPSLGMGKSCAPAFLPLVFRKNQIVMTFHEFEQFNLIRKMYFLLPLLLKTKYIFTNEYEQKCFARFFPWAKKNSTIIPIGNNINIFPYEKKADHPEHRLIYFGQIAPDKGIEDYLETVRCLRTMQDDISCAIIGAFLDPSNDLAQEISESAREYNIECLFNLSSEDVSKELQKSSIALLPFPGGVGDKRGSALACLKHGLAVVTKHTNLTPRWWKESTHHAQTPENAAGIIQAISTGKTVKVPVPATLEKALDDREWRHIANTHMKLIRGESL